MWGKNAILQVDERKVLQMQGFYIIAALFFKVFKKGITTLDTMTLKCITVVE